MKMCAWCYEEGVIEKNQHSDDEKGAIDNEGNWICDDCRDAAEENTLDASL